MILSMPITTYRSPVAEIVKPDRRLEVSNATVVDVLRKLLKMKPVLSQDLHSTLWMIVETSVESFASELESPDAVLRSLKEHVQVEAEHQFHGHFRELRAASWLQTPPHLAQVCSLLSLFQERANAIELVASSVSGFVVSILFDRKEWANVLMNNYCNELTS